MTGISGLGYVPHIMKLLDSTKTAVLVVDVQEKLMPVMARKERVTGNILKLLQLSETFSLPLILTEHHTRWLGPTLPEIKEALPAYEPITKMHFNCCEVDAFKERLRTGGVESVIIAGVESHICIFQTCASMVAEGYRVHVPQDAVDARTDENWKVGLDLMRGAGAVVTSTEAVIYQILKKAGTKEFKRMLKLIK